MGVWKTIVDYTVPSNTTSVDFTGLNITKDDFIKINVTNINNIGSGSVIRLFPNTTAGVSGFDSTTNYHFQLLDSSGSSIFATRVNFNEINFTPSNSTNYSNSYFKLSENGVANFFTNYFRTLDSSLVNRFLYTTSSGVTFTDPITSLTFNSDQTNGIGAGSRIQIYKLTAKKVADIIVSDDTTQIDITGLDIKKGDEYLLVSDYSSVSNEAFRPRIGVNGNNTITDYYVQVITGNGSSASAERANRSEIGFVPINRKTLIYAHLKLSNIGAFTSQTYEIRDSGSSDIILSNSFVSSISETISSINRITIFDGANNQALATGSRLQLYKLYEGGN